MKNVFLSLSTATFLALSLNVYAAPKSADAITKSGLSVKDGYVRAVPPASENTAAYMTFTNTGKKAVTLTKAESASARAVELHEHIHENGMMKMVQVKSIEVPAEGTTELEPMGLHIMLIGLKSGFSKEKSVKMTFFFSDGTKLTETLPVKKDEE